MLDEESKAKITEFARELKAFMEERDLLFWEGGIVRVAPVGVPPAFCTVEIEGVWDENVEWRGAPGGLVAGDAVLVWENPATHRREIIGASGAGASTPFVHDHSSVAEGGDDLNPETFSPQTFIVGPTPCPYDTLGEAVAAVNAFGPTAANPCTIRVQGIATAETGGVTIPRYCHVEGVGEGSTIAMGANQIDFDDYSSALDIVFTSTHATSCLTIGGETDVELRNVKVISLGTGYCFLIGSSTNIALYDCIAEAPGAASHGFHIGGTASGIVLEGCTADTTNLTWALYITNTASVVTKYCTFKGSFDVFVGASATWQHFDCRFDPNNCVNQIAAGTHTALPTKRFNQCLIVAEHGGDFQALSEAITWINNQGDAASDKLYGVEMKHGNFAEAANVTIPQYVHVFGMGRGTEIEMGNKILFLSSDSSLKDVTVETTMDATGNKYAIDINNATGWELRNVLIRFTPHTSGANVAFYFRGSSEGSAHHCIADPQGSSATGTVIGFCAENTADVLLWDCEADDTTNLTDGLWIGDTATVTTKYCTFRADGDDVEVGASAFWEHIKCNYDANNCTIAGTETPLRDGAIEIASDAIRGHTTLYPDIGTTTLAQKLGNIYLGHSRDIYPDHDIFGLWDRVVNWSFTPDEHWGQNADELAWTGWAGYAGFANPPASITRTTSMLHVAHNAAARAFYYRAAAVGDHIFLRTRASLGYLAEGGIMIDDGVGNADGNGANNFYRVFLDGLSGGLAANWLAVEQYRTGGGAVTTNTAFSLPPALMYGLVIHTSGTRWGNWRAAPSMFGEPGRRVQFTGGSPLFNWTPARVGLFFRTTAADFERRAIWNWYDEATS